MTALSADFNREEKEGKLLAMPVEAAAVVYKNALLMINPDGYVQPAAALLNATYAGMAYEAADNSAGANGDVVVRIERLNAIVIEGSGFVAGDLGKSAYASDDNTVSTTQATNEVLVGIVVEVISATKVLVKQDTSVA